MNLQGDASLRRTDLRVGQIGHRYVVEPRLHAVALHLQAQRVPLPFAEHRLLLVGDLHQPAAPVGLVDAGRVVVLRRHLALPAVDLHGRLDERAEEDPRIAVGQLPEFERQVEVVVVFARGEVAVLPVGTALADEVAGVVDIPLLGAVDLPAREVAAVEELDLTPGTAGQLLDFQVAERGRIAVVLQADDPAVRQSVLGCAGPLAAVAACEPVVGPGLELQNLVSVEPVLDMAVVADDARRVPLALRIDKERVGIGQVHGVVHAEALPRFEARRGVLLLPAVVVDELVLGARHVGYRKGGVLDHVVEHAAVAAVGELPVPVEDEVFVLPARDDVAGQVAAVAVGLDAAVDHVPGHRQPGAVVVLPLIERLAVEEQLPAVCLLGSGERVVRRRTGRGRQQQGAPPQGRL